MAPLIIGLAVFALIILLLVLPLGIRLSASFHGGAIFNARIQFLSGLLSWEVSTGRARREKRAGSDTQKTGNSGMSSMIEAAQVKGLGAKVKLLVKRIYRRVKVQSVQSDLRVSLGDDYYTGMLAGLLIAPVLYLNQRFDGTVLIQPVFEEDLFLEGDIHGDLQVRPIHVLVPCLGFALSPEFRRMRKIVAGGSCIKR
ncbi:MAG: hypothetical protein WC169_04600 [Dehalococcoidia bacterium]